MNAGGVGKGSCRSLDGGKMPENRWATNPIEFQKTIGAELDAIQNRVRLLIGDTHWGEEGRYKESILKDILKRFLPENIGVGTGFIIKKRDGEIFRSGQIDIIIYDTSIPVLLKEGDFIVTTPENVIAIIEVKTNISIDDIQKFTGRFEKIKQVLNNDIFFGIYCFNDEDTNKNNFKARFERFLTHSEGMVNHISIGNRLFIRYFNQEEINTISESGDRNPFWGIYYFEGRRSQNTHDLKGLAPAYFISNLIDFVMIKKRLNLGLDRNWFLFPLSEGKRPYEIDRISLLR